MACFAPAANASTKVGDDGNFGGQCVVVGSDYTVFAADTGYTVPSDGVITAFRAVKDSQTTDYAGTKFKVGRFSGSQVTGVGEATAQSDGAALTATARIPVLAGDRLGESLRDGRAFNCIDGGNGGLTIVYRDLAPGETADYHSAFDSIRVSLAATLEPDADLDGYGDESQDSCPSDPAIHEGSCTPGPDTTVRVDGPLTPFAANGSSRFKLGTVLEVRVKPTRGGELITDLKPQVNIVRTGNPTGPQTPTVAVLKRSADAGKTARYSAQFGQYQFYAATLKSQFNAGKDLVPGQYRVDVSDPVFPGAAHKVARNFAIVP